jgi:hypothetical protein
MQTVITNTVANIMENRVSRNGRNLIVNAERRTVVQNQGSRGVVVERSRYAQILEINSNSIRKVDETINGKPMQSRYSKK